MITPLSYHDLIETLPRPGCVICNLAKRDVSRRIDSLLYEYVNEPETHTAFRASRGLCNEHAWQLTKQTGYVLGVAILCRAAIHEVLKIIDNTPAQPATSRAGLGRLLGGSQPGVSTLADALEPAGPCLACEALVEAERRYVEVLAEYLAQERVIDALRRSEGLCLPHFRATLRYVRSPADLQNLLAAQQAIWERLYSELGTFIEKHDHQKRAPMGYERDSTVRAIRGLAGEQGVFGERRSD